MAEIKKYKSRQALHLIQHILRDLPPGKTYSNPDIVPELSANNYSLINRGNAEEQNRYRLKLTNEIFKYDRKGLVYMMDAVFQAPDDCPPDQRPAFFTETYKHYVSTLPMKESCVIYAEVHRDEKHYTPDGRMISKEHLHIGIVPGVPDNKHDGFQWKLSAHDLTSNKRLRELHPAWQKHLNSCGINATVYRKKKGEGKNIGLSVPQLKEITAKTGMVIDKPLTRDEIVKLLIDNHNIKIHDQKLNALVERAERIEKDKDREIERLKREIAGKDRIISDYKSREASIEKSQETNFKDTEIIKKANEISNSNPSENNAGRWDKKDISSDSYSYGGSNSTKKEGGRW